MAENDEERDESEMDEEINDSGIEELKAKLRRARADLKAANRESASRRKQLEKYEGATILADEEKAEWEAYRQLGKPDEVKGKLEAAATAETELANERKAARLKEAAELMGFKPQVWTDLATHRSLDVEFEGEGKERKAFVKHGDKRTELKEYAEANLGDYLPALQATEERRTESTRWTPQPAGGGGADDIDPTDETMGKRYPARTK